VLADIVIDIHPIITMLRVLVGTWNAFICSVFRGARPDVLQSEIRENAPGPHQRHSVCVSVSVPHLLLHLLFDGALPFHNYPSHCCTKSE
jgi:hypothetical protein